MWFGVGMCLHFYSCNSVFMFYVCIVCACVYVYVWYGMRDVYVCDVIL